MEGQTINQILNINVNNAAPAVPNTGFVTSSTGLVDHLGVIGCSVLFAIIIGFTVIAVLLLLQYKRHQQKSSLFLGTGLLAVSFGLFVPSLAMTSTGISGDTPETLETNIDIVTTPEGQVATGDTTITLANDMPDGFAIYAYMENDNALYNADGSAKIEATALTSSTNPNSLSLNSYGLLNINTKQYAPIVVGAEQAQTVYTTSKATSAGAQVNLTFAAKLDGSVPTDNYTGHIVFKVAPTLYIQDVTDEVCQTFEYDKQIPVVDKRDGKTYTIAHLRDDRCWMTQNLNLGYTDQTMTLTPKDSNVNEDFVLPASSLYWEDDDFDVPQIYQPDGTINEGEYGRDFDGTFYNWNAATAGSGNSSIVAGDDHSVSVNSSICPKGWQLPQYGYDSIGLNNAYDAQSNEYYNMLRYYLPTDGWGRWGNPSWNGPRKSIPADPLNFYYDGYVESLHTTSDSNSPRHIGHYDLGQSISGTWWFNTALELYDADGQPQGTTLDTPFAAAVLDIYSPEDMLENANNTNGYYWKVDAFDALRRHSGASIRCVTQRVSA